MIAEIRVRTDDINLAQLNANGIKSNFSELKDFMKNHAIDIMLINETKVNSNTKFFVPGYNVIRKDRFKGQGGGVLIFIHADLKYTEIDINTKSIETVTIKLNDNIDIASAYNPPQSKLSVEDLDLIFKCSRKVLMFGDLDAKGMSWKYHKGNANGKIFQEFATKNMLVILSPDSFTLYPYNNASPSVVDIDLAKNIGYNIDINVIDNLSSDHNLVLIKLNVHNIVQKYKRVCMDYKKANWQRMRTIINKNLTLKADLKTTADVNARVESLIRVVFGAVNETIPNKTSTNFYKHLPNYIRNLVKNRNSLRRIFQRTVSNTVRKIKNQLANKINREISKVNNTNWNNKLKSIKIQDNSLRKMAKCPTKGKLNTIPTLHGKNGMAVSDDDKANVLADHYESLSDGGYRG